jgi:malate dehydrogenase
MTTRQRIKVAVTGAAGQIGYALVFRIASGQMFGPNVDVELQMLELPAALGSLEGVAMELDDCAFPLLKNIVCTDNLNTAMDGVNWSILVGAVPRKQGMERSDLLAINGKLFIDQGKAINDRAADDVRVFVVGNPCNTNALIALNHAKDVPNDRFYAMMMLDELRAQTLLAKKAGVDVTSLAHMNVWGNHSATQFPDIYHAEINGKNAFDVINKDQDWVENTFLPTIQQRGAAVIKQRGASSAGSAANAVIQSVHNIMFDTPAGQTFSTAKYSNGEYGIEKGLMFSFPCRTENGKVITVEGLSHHEYAQQQIQHSHDELRSERDMVKELGLID